MTSETKITEYDVLLAMYDIWTHIVAEKTDLTDMLERFEKTFA